MCDTLMAITNSCPPHSFCSYYVLFYPYNERIERLWNDVHRSVTEEFRCLFYQLQHEGYVLPPFVFESRINCAINKFAVAWNNHILSLRDTDPPINFL